MARAPYTMRVLRETLGREVRDFSMWHGVLARPRPEALTDLDRKVPGMAEKYERQLEEWHAEQLQASKSISSGEVRIEDLRRAIAILENNF